MDAGGRAGRGDGEGLWGVWEDGPPGPGSTFGRGAQPGVGPWGSLEQQQGRDWSGPVGLAACAPSGRSVLAVWPWASGKGPSRGDPARAARGCEAR